MRRWIVLLAVAAMAAGCRAQTTPRPPAPASHQAATYQHIGQQTVGRYAAVSGTLTVTPVRLDNGPDSFLVQRFLARSDQDPIQWLEAGWAQHNGYDHGHPVIYTYSTVDGAWQFYPQYPISVGDSVDIRLLGTPHSGGSLWTAWLRWRGTWHELTQVSLSISATAIIEEYVELLTVQPVLIQPTKFADVSLQDVNGHQQGWDGSVPVLFGQINGSYCVALAGTSLTGYSC